MARKKWVPAIGTCWFVRMKGASALATVEMLNYCGNNIWHYRDFGIYSSLPTYGEEGTDFKVVAPFPSTVPEKS